MENLCLLKCMDSHSALMADGPNTRDLSFMCNVGYCCQISVTNGMFLQEKVLATLVQFQLLVAALK